MIEPRADVGSDDRPPRRLLPERMRRAVVHHQVAVAEQAGDAELEHLFADRALEGDRGVAERAERHRDGLAADHVVDDLVPGEDVERIPARVAVELDMDDRDRVDGDRGRFFDGLEARILDRGDAIAPGAAGAQLLEFDDADAPERAPLERAEARRRAQVADDRDALGRLHRIGRQVGEERRHGPLRFAFLLLLLLLLLPGGLLARFFFGGLFLLLRRGLGLLLFRVLLLLSLRSRSSVLLRLLGGDSWIWLRRWLGVIAAGGEAQGRDGGERDQEDERAKTRRHAA